MVALTRDVIRRVTANNCGNWWPRRPRRMGNQWAVGLTFLPTEELPSPLNLDHCPLGPAPSSRERQAPVMGACGAPAVHFWYLQCSTLYLWILGPTAPNTSPSRSPSVLVLVMLWTQLKASVNCQRPRTTPPVVHNPHPILSVDSLSLSPHLPRVTPNTLRPLDSYFSTFCPPRTAVPCSPSSLRESKSI